MNCRSVVLPRWLKCGLALLLFSTAVVLGQPVPPRPRQFAPGTLNRIEDLPASRLRTRIEGLPGAARQRALDRLRSFHFTELDLESLETDADGELFYVDHFSINAAAVEVEPEP